MEKRSTSRKPGVFPRWDATLLQKSRKRKNQPRLQLRPDVTGRAYAKMIIGSTPIKLIDSGIGVIKLMNNAYPDKPRLELQLNFLFEGNPRV